jgi:DNA-binding transcriptional MerR regulator
MEDMGPAECGAVTRLTAKALRLYEPRGLLTPAFTDSVNGYRRYSAAQTIEAGGIASLLPGGIGLSDIARFLAWPTRRPSMAGSLRLTPSVVNGVVHWKH